MSYCNRAKKQNSKNTLLLRCYAGNDSRRLAGDGTAYSAELSWMDSYHMDRKTLCAGDPTCFCLRSPSQRPVAKSGVPPIKVLFIYNADPHSITKTNKVLVREKVPVDRVF